MDTNKILVGKQRKLIRNSQTLPPPNQTNPKNPQNTTQQKKKPNEKKETSQSWLFIILMID